MREHIVSIVLVFSFLVVIPLMTYDLWGESALAGVVMQKVNTYRLNQGLVGWWTFDGTDLTDKVYDRSGQNNHGYFEGGATSSAKVAGKVGQAMQFDGVDDYVNIQDSPVFDLYAANAYTWSIWVKPTSFKEWSVVWGQQESIVPNDAEVWIYAHTTSDVNHGPVTAGVTFGWCSNDGGDCSETLTVHSTNNVLTVNAWHHVLISYDGTLVQTNRSKIYVDGVDVTDTGDVNSNGTLGNIFPTAGNTNIGRDGEWDNFGHHSLDDVRIYNRALSASEVKLLYTSTAGSKMNTSKNVIPGSTLQTGLVGLWSFDGKDMDWRANKALDKSGQGNDGELVDMATATAPVSGKIGQGMNFDGVDDGVDLQSDAVGNGPVTVAAWIYPRSTGGGGYGMIFYGHSEFYFQFAATNALLVYSSNPGGSSGNDITFNQWNHVVYTRTGVGTSNFYINGTLSGTPNQNNGAPLSGLYDSWIGRRNDGAYAFDGTIDDVRVYNRVLSAAEVKDLYTATAGTKVNTSQNVVPGSTLQQGLVGLWSFNGPDTTDKVYDRSGQNNHGYFVGNATNSAKTSGKVGQGLKFDGVDDWVNTVDIDEVDNASYLSISTWIRQDALAADKAIVSKWSAGFPHWVFFTDPSFPDALRFTFGINSSTVIAPEGSHEVGEWEHWVVVFDGTASGDANRLKMFKNASAQSLSFSNAVPATLSSNANTIKIGASSDVVSPCCFWNGKLDEVRIYDRALNPAEIKLLYNLGR